MTRRERFNKGERRNYRKNTYARRSLAELAAGYGPRVVYEAKLTGL